MSLLLALLALGCFPIQSLGQNSVAGPDPGAGEGMVAVAGTDAEREAPAGGVGELGAPASPAAPGGAVALAQSGFLADPAEPGGVVVAGGSTVGRSEVATSEPLPTGRRRLRDCFANLIVNPEFRVDENGDGSPDGWIAGSTVSLVRDSAVGCTILDPSSGQKALWIKGGRDMAGEWATRIRGLEPGRTYVLSLHLFRKEFRNGWYPEIEVFGQRTILNQHASYGAWQPIEMLFTAPEDTGTETWFRFINRFPCDFWLGSLRLSPYCLTWESMESTRSGVTLRWKETPTELVLKMDLSVTNAKGLASQESFLNVEARGAWYRSQGSGKQASKGGDAAVQTGLPARVSPEPFIGMAWLPRKGPGPFRMRLSAVFEDRGIAEISAEGVQIQANLRDRDLAACGGHDSDDLVQLPTTSREKDLPGRIVPLQPARRLPRDFFPIGIFNVPLDGVRQAEQAGFNAVYLDLPREDLETLLRRSDLKPSGPLPGGRTDGRGTIRNVSSPLGIRPEEGQETDKTPEEKRGVDAGPPGTTEERLLAGFRSLPEAPLRWMLSLRRGRGPVFAEDLPLLHGLIGLLGKREPLLLYTADEPELAGITPARLYACRQQLQQAFPEIPTAAAVFRERLLPYYAFCADWFFIDPYPVPNRPLTWMADALDSARGVLGEGRAIACVQAFGGEDVHGSELMGWARFPTLEEMRVLAFLAVVHGASGVFFYEYAAASRDPDNWQKVVRVVKDLKETTRRLLPLTPDHSLSSWSVTPEGWKKEANDIHAALYSGGGKGVCWTLIAVNPWEWEAQVRFEGLPGQDQVVTELLEGRPVMVKDGRLFDTMKGLGVHVYTSACEGS